MNDIIRPDEVQNPRLLPCPFCGGTDQVIQADHSEDDGRIYAHHVFCRDCHACGRNHYPSSWCESEKAAIEAWNDRNPWYRGWFRSKTSENWHWTDDGKKSICGMVLHIHERAPWVNPNNTSFICKNCIRAIRKRGYIDAGVDVKSEEVKE